MISSIVSFIFNTIMTVLGAYLLMTEMFKQLPLPFLLIVGLIFIYIGYNIAFAIDNIGYKFYEDLNNKCNYKKGLLKIIEDTNMEVSQYGVDLNTEVYNTFVCKPVDSTRQIFLKLANVFSIFFFVIFVYPPISALMSKLIDFLAQ